MKHNWNRGRNTSWQLVLTAAWLLTASAAQANVSITAATGGSNISADKAADAASPAWTSLGSIVIGEPGGSTGDIVSGGTLILETPSGFEFNTAVNPSISFTSGRDITTASVSVTASNQITITIVLSGSNARDTLTIGGTVALQVRPVTGTVLASGRIHRSEADGGTAVLSGVTAGPTGTSFGNLSMAVGEANRLDLQVAPPTTATAGTAFSPQPRVAVTDQFGNVITSTDSTVVTARALGGTANLTGTTNVTSNNGIVSYSNLGYNRAETIAVAFTSTGLTGTNSAPLIVSAVAADRLGFMVQPISGDYTGTLQPNPVVQSQDPYGNPSTIGLDASKVVNLALSSGTGTLLGVVPQDIGTAAGNGTVTFSNLSLTAAGSNKRLTASAAGLTSGVSAAFTINPLLVTGSVTIASRPYNGTNTATILTRTLDGVLPGETCNLSGGTATFTDKNVGTNKLVTVTGLTLTGTHSGNYQLVSTTATNVADITRASLALSADDTSRAYGATNPILSATYYGLAPNETPATGGITGVPALNTTATPASPLGDYPITVALGTLASTNYTFDSFTNGTLTVTKAPLQVVADSKWKAQGSANPPLTASYVGFVNGDTTAVLSGSPNLSTTATTGSAVGNYPITVTTGSLTASNYSFTPVNGTLTVLAQGSLWYSPFTRPTQPGALDPWQLQTGVWTITNGLLRGGSNLLSRYSQIYLTNSWSNASVQAKFQFPAGAFGGGLGARLTATNGAHYAAWIYPAGSPGGSNMVKLLKFNSWLGFAWSNVVSLPMGQASVPPVGTGTNTLKLAFHGTQVAVHFNGNRVISVDDTELAANREGGLTVEQWTDTNAYVMTVDEVLVSTLAAPVASNNTYLAVQNTTLTVPAPGIVGNDRTEVYDLAPILVSSPTKGVLSLDTNGGFSYTPNAGASGSDSFTYRATDGLATSGVATVTLNIQTNSPPVAAADSYAALSGAALMVSAPGVVDNDSDPEGQPLFALLQSGPTNGVLTLSTNGGFTYTSTVGFVGTDRFTYRATDTLYTSAPVTVTLSVTRPTSLLNEAFTRTNDPAPITPWVAQAGNWSITGGKLVGGTNSLSTYGHAYLATNWTDFSVEGKVTFPTNAYGGGLSGRLNPATGARYAAWIFPENSPGGSKTLKLLKFQNWGSFGSLAQATLPAVGIAPHTLRIAFQGTRIGVRFDGVPLITVADTDPSASLSGGIGTEFWTDSVAYQPVFDDIIVRLPAAPVATNNTYSTPFNTVLSVPAPGVLSNDFVEIGPLTALVAANPTKGTLTLTNDGGFRYAPNAGATGSDSFTYRATDGVSTSAVATVTIQIGTNATPTAVNDSLTAMAGVPLVVPPPGVLANDTDPDGQPLSAILVTGPTNGSLILSTNGGLTYTAPTNYLGSDTFTYRATDGSRTSSVATVSISVVAWAPLLSENFTRGNDPAPITPWVAQAGNWSITGGKLVGGSNTLSTYGYAYLDTNWTDFSVEGKVTFPANAYGGGLCGRLNPATGARYAAWIFPENSPGGARTLKLLKFQNWGSFGTLAQAALPAVGTTARTLKLAFQGNQIGVLYDGTRLISVTDTDASPYLSGGIGVEFWTDSVGYQPTFDDIVVQLPRPPVATNDSYTTVSNGVLSVSAPGLLANDFAEVGTLTAIVAANPVNGTLILTNNGGFRYTPNAGFTGTDSFTYQASDGFAASSPVTVSIQVRTNTAPTAVNDTLTAMAGVPLVLAPPGVLANDTDPDGQNLTAILVAGPTHGSLTFSTNGGLTYTAPGSYLGPDTFTYRATDGFRTSIVATVSITVVASGPLLSENFTRTNDPAPITPWIAQAGTWSVTGGLMRGGPNSPNSGYAYAYLNTNWTDLVLEGKVRLGAGAFGGGLGGRLNSSTGSRYAAWLYPAGSAGGSNVLKLLKFSSWGSFGYTNVTSGPMATVPVPDVGTNWHTLKLTFQGNSIKVSYDGVAYLDVADVEASPYAVGGLSAEFWTAGSAHAMDVDDISVTLPPAAGGEPTFTGITRAANGNIILSLQGTPNTQYVLQAAPGLTTTPAWNNISTNTSSASGTWSVTNAPGAATQRYYRAMKP